MRNIKKALCLIIVFVNVLTSLEVFADTKYFEPYKYMDSIYQFDIGDFVNSKLPESAGAEVKSEYQEYIDFLDAIGIWDNTEKKPASLLTKTEFDIMIARARLGVVNAFEDTYVKQASTDLVAYSEVLKYLLEGLGYYYQCAEFGYTDESLLIVANKIKLIGKDIVIPDITDSISRGEFAQILVKALQIDMCEKQYVSGTYKYVVDTNKNLLNTVHEVYDVSGFVNAVPGVAVYGKGDVKTGSFEINRIRLYSGDKNVRDYFGKQVIAYVKNDEVTGKNNLVYITENEEYTSLEIDFSELLEVNTNYIMYNDASNKEQEVDVSELKNIIQNGDKLAGITDMADFESSNGKLILTSSEEKDVYDTAVIWKYTYFQVQSNSKINNKIYLAKNLTYNNSPFIPMNDKNINIIYVNDEATEWNAIPIGACVRMARSSDGKYTEMYAYTKSSVAGKVTEAYENTVKIGNKQYKISEDLLAYMKKCVEQPDVYKGKDRIEEITVGTTGTFYLFKNYVIAFSHGSEYSYAFLRSMFIDKKAIDPGASIKIFTEDGEWQTYPLSDKLTLDGKSGVKKHEAVEIITANSDVVLYDLIRYQVNTNNEIVALDTMINSAHEVNDTSRIKFDYHFEGELGWTKSYLGPDIKYRVDEQSMWFKIPDDLTEEDLYKVVYTGSFSTDTPIKLDLYSADEFYISRVGIVPANIVATPTGNLTFVYVEKIVNILLDAEKEKIGYKIECSEFKNLRARASGTIRPRTFTVDEHLFKSMDIKVGDFIKLTENATTLEGGQTVIRDSAVPDTDIVVSTGSTSYMGVGTIKKIDYENAYILIECNVDGVVKEIVSIPRAKGHINTSTHRVQLLEISDLNVDDRIFFFDLSGNTSWLFTSE